ncbi:hypothetical protein A9Q87_08210 [Flavobacteriales bacterium 34_180_T64]|nr:hypothetical protein A9Q87_08210 [Flavobacteriales bacterium 34_180_T64]
MKLLNRGLLILVLALFTCNISFAQEEKKEDAPIMFSVHTDNVKFAMMPQYEKLAKQLKENCEKHNVQGVDWTAISIEDGRYVFVSQIENMAELDKNIFAELFEKMGKEAAGAMFDKMDECYDSHSNSITHYIPALSYHPEGYSSEGKNHREYHFLYYAPKDGKAMGEAMEGVKKLFEAKGVKNGYSVYHSGFGSEESYFMVSIAGTSDMSIAQGGMENDKLLGDEKDATFFNVIKLTTKYDQVEGTIRPDLSYYPKK